MTATANALRPEFFYEIDFSESEVESLRWLADRYSYAEIIWKATCPASGRCDLAEHEAWDLQSCVNDGVDGGYLPCAGGSLREKIDGLLNSII